nr:unnamed protein product [uncultured bacterium]
MAKVRQALSDTVFDDYSDARVTTMGHITEVVTMKKRCFGPPVVRIDKDHFMDLRTGELLEYEHIENRAESTDSIHRTLSHIRALINTNVTVPENCRWVTLTYSENMTDTKRLYKDYERFWKRFCYWCKTNGFEKPEYITVQEPQGRGAWHIHAFFIWPGKAPFIPNNEVLWKLWGQGFTKIKSLENCDNIGAYFSAYLGDMPLDEVYQLPSADQIRAFGAGGIEEKDFSNEQGHIKKKKFVKGGRLFLYPPKMNIVRKTKGIKLPLVERMTYSAAKEKVRSAKQTFSRAYDVVADDGSVINTICKTYYNSRRKDESSSQ